MDIYIYIYVTPNLIPKNKDAELLFPARIVFGKAHNGLALWLWEAWRTGSLGVDSFPLELRCEMFGYYTGMHFAKK